MQVEPCQPTYVKVWVNADWDVEPYWVEADVKRRVEDAVSHLLSFDQVSFGGSLFLSKIYEAVEQVEGVRYVTVTRFQRDDDPDNPASHLTPGRLRFKAHEIPQAGHERGILLGPKRPEADHAR